MVDETTGNRVEISILFFGAVAEIVGMRSIPHTLFDNTKSNEALAEVVNKFPKLSSQKLLFAINQQYATGDELINDGDELAIFTAVSGG